MVAFLSQDWLAALVGSMSAVPPAPGATALVEYVVNGAPEGAVTYFVQYEDGRVADAGVGKAPGDPDLVFTLAYKDAVPLGTGESELSAAYMQGSLKAEGSMPALFALLPATHRPEFRDAVSAAAADTSF